MKKKFLLFLLFIFLVSFVYGENDKPVVAIQPIVVAGDIPLAAPVAETVGQTLLLSLKLMGEYTIAEPEEDDWADFDTLRAACDKWGLDSIITGFVLASPETGFSVTLSLFDRRENTVVLTETEESTSFLDIFEITDRLTLKLLEGMSDGHLAVGSLYLINEGPSRPFFLEIDGAIVGENIFELNLLKEGTHDVRVFEIANNREIVSLQDTVTITENQQSLLSFALLSEEDYLAAVTRPVLYAPGGTFHPGKGIYSPEAGDTGVTLNPFTADRFLLTAGEVVDLLNEAHEEGLLDMDRREVTYLPPDEGEPQELLIIKPGLFTHTPYVYKDDRLEVKPGEAGKPASFLTWYGAVFVAHRLSLAEGLDSCYDLSDWSCNFGNNGYRIPTETEFLYMEYLQDNEDEWSTLEESEELSRIWIWDWFQRFRSFGNRDSQFYGPETGMRNTSMGSAIYEKRKNRLEESDRKAGVRLVRTENQSFREYGVSLRERLRQNTIEPRLGVGFTFEDMKFNYISAGVQYRRTLNPLFSFGGGFSVGGALYDDGDWHTAFEIDLVPLVIGRQDNLAVGLYLGLLVLDDAVSSSDLGIDTQTVYGIPSLLIIYRNFSLSLQFSVPAWNAVNNDTGMSPSQVMSLGYGIRF